jgi:hypothetical protein
MPNIDQPFTQEQVESFNAYQRNSGQHPYTCGIESIHKPLIASTDGLRCVDCEYYQSWAHSFSLGWMWKRE